MRQLRLAGFEQPVLIYTWASRAEQERNDVLATGAAAVTASPTELFAALQELLRPPRPGARPAHPAGQQPPPSPRQARVAGDVRLTRGPGLGVPLVVV